jgi:hypothetical protein
MEACWQFWLQSLPKDTSVSVVAEVLCLKEWAHAKWWFEKSKTNWANPKVWASSSNQGQLVSGLRFKRKFKIGPGHAAQGATGIWYENSYTKFQSLMERWNSQNLSQSIGGSDSRENKKISIERNFQNVNAQNPILDLSLSRSQLISCWRMLKLKLS